MEKRSEMKLLTVFGTRPEVIKMAPVINELGNFPDHITCINCVTAQHREMIDTLLALFSLRVDYDLDIMCEDQKLDYITTTVMEKAGHVLDLEDPDYLLVQGDTTTAMAASLAAYHRGVRVAHIEAGLRTWDKLNPFPEEINRKIIDALSDVCFAPTEEAKHNLLAEGVAEDIVLVTGNTGIDALLDVASRDVGFQGTPVAKLSGESARIILVTAHRRESLGQPLADICTAIKEIAVHQSDVIVVFPVHLNPNVRQSVYSSLSGLDNVILTDPLEYEQFVHVMKMSYIIVTDSGGLQEEAPSLGKPVLVIRETTERPEAVAAGAARVVGRDPGRIVEEIDLLCDDHDEYRMRTRFRRDLYGDGHAARRITEFFLGHVKQ